MSDGFCGWQVPHRPTHMPALLPGLQRCGVLVRAVTCHSPLILSVAIWLWNSLSVSWRGRVVGSGYGNVHASPY